MQACKSTAVSADCESSHEGEAKKRQTSAMSLAHHYIFSDQLIRPLIF